MKRLLIIGCGDVAGAFKGVGILSVACAVRTVLGCVVVRTAHATR